MTDFASLPNLDTILPKQCTSLDFTAMGIYTHVYATGWSNAVGSLEIMFWGSRHFPYTKLPLKVGA